MNPVFLAILLISAPPTFEVETLDGRRLAGPLAELSAERIAVDAPSGRVTLATDEILTILRKEKPKPEGGAVGAVVELSDGSLIRARQFVARGGRARVTLGDGEVLETPAAAVRTVLCDLHPSDQLRAEWSRLVGMTTDADLLIVRNGETIDYHKGVLHDVSEQSVLFEIDGEVLPVKWAKIHGFAYRHSAGSKLPAAVCRIVDATGSAWQARSVALGGGLQWTTPAGVSVSRPLEDIVAIDFSAGKVAYLSDLKPEAIVWTPYFGVREPPAAVREFFAPRFDRGFDGGSLRLGGVAYGKGLAMHSRTELVYRLPERFSRFRATAGIADVLRPNGNVRLVVRGDDKTLFEARLTGKDAPRSIEADITGVRRLTILADFGDRPSAGSQLLLGNARVSK
jgi:hypothetical protein